MHPSIPIINLLNNVSLFHSTDRPTDQSSPATAAAAANAAKPDTDLGFEFMDAAAQHLPDQSVATAVVVNGGGGDGAEGNSSSSSSSSSSGSGGSGGKLGAIEESSPRHGWPHTNPSLSHHRSGGSAAGGTEVLSVSVGMGSAKDILEILRRAIYAIAHVLDCAARQVKKRKGGNGEWRKEGRNEGTREEQFGTTHLLVLLNERGHHCILHLFSLFSTCAILTAGGSGGGAKRESQGQDRRRHRTVPVGGGGGARGGGGGVGDSKHRAQRRRRSVANAWGPSGENEYRNE